VIQKYLVLKMKKYRLSFAQINVVDDCIAEVIFDKAIDVSIEMMEEIETFACGIFNDDFGVIVNKIYPYTYCPGATLTLGSMERMKAIASINYIKEGTAITQDIVHKRRVDMLNIKPFNGLALGRQQAIDWLLNELACH